jgi:hypothetical protein
LVTCPSCGLRLPQFARFCARCGQRLPSARSQAAPVWILIVFWLGTALLLLVAVAYAIAAVTPNLPPEGVDPNQLRLAASAIALVAGALFVVQLVASLGLTLGQPWARAMATVVCVLWALTCVGLLLAIPVLSTIWRSRRAAEPPLAPPA